MGCGNSKFPEVEEHHPQSISSTSSLKHNNNNNIKSIEHDKTGGQEAHLEQAHVSRKNEAGDSTNSSSFVAQYNSTTSLTDAKDCENDKESERDKNIIDEDVKGSVSDDSNVDSVRGGCHMKSTDDTPSPLTTPKLRQHNSSVSNCDETRDMFDPDSFQKRGMYSRRGSGGDSSISRAIGKSLSDRSTMSREDSGLSKHLSDKSSFSTRTNVSGNISMVSGMTNMSPIRIAEYEDICQDAAAELRNEECSDKGDETENISEWKDYLRSLNSNGNQSNDESESDDDISEMDIDVQLESANDDEVPGYFLYITAEGHKVWILLDENKTKTDYNDEVVEKLIEKGSDPNSMNDGTYFSPFHLSRDDAITNVIKVKEFVNKENYERALLLQAEEQERRMKTRQENFAITDEDGETIEQIDRKSVV